jgi:hypothetical protein
MLTNIKTLGFTALLSLAAIKGQEHPGYCSLETGNCTSDHTCISVATDQVGLVRLSQCTVEPVCSGIYSGMCPTFGSWPEPYARVQAMCAFFVPNDPCADPSNPDQNGTVTCVSVPIVTGIDSNGTYNITQRDGIYGCMGMDKYRTMYRNDIPTEVLDAQFKDCKGEGEDSVLCNGKGTCAPSGEASEYKCKCAAGYHENDNCKAAVSNQCSTFGQCGVGGVCDMKKHMCVCDAGVTGFQCTHCDPQFNSTLVCNGGGTCENTGNEGFQCSCGEFFDGQFCQNDHRDTSSAMAATASVILVSITSVLAMLCTL